MGLNEDKVAERFPRASLSGSSRVIHLGPAAKAARAFSTRVFQTPLSQVYLIRKDKRATVKRLPANHRCSATRSCIIAGMCIPPEHFLFINHKIAKWDTPCHKFSKETAWTPQCLICVCFFFNHIFIHSSNLTFSNSKYYQNIFWTRTVYYLFC